MKIKYLKLKSWLLVSLGSLLGLSSCCCMYGTPTATYHLNGTVTNSEGHPIEGIGVGRYSVRSEESDSIMLIKYHDTTDAKGQYKLTYDHYDAGINILLDLHDIDEGQNGDYKDTVVTVPTRNVQLSGGHGWYNGEGTITVDVTMTEKTNK